MESYSFFYVFLWNKYALDMRIFINDRQLKKYALLIVKTLKSENSKYKSKTYYNKEYFEFIVAEKG